MLSPLVVFTESAWAAPSSDHCSKMGGTWSAGSWGWYCTGGQTSNTWNGNNKANLTSCEAFGGTWSAGSWGWSCSGAVYSGTWTTGGNGSGNNGNNGGNDGGNNGGNNGNNGGNNGGNSGNSGSGGIQTTDSTNNSTSSDFPPTAILNISGCTDGSGIFEILALGLSIVTYGVGAAAVIGVIISAYQYITARDNSAQVAKAKNRILQIIIGLAIWVLIWGILQFLLPGGLFANGS